MKKLILLPLMFICYQASTQSYLDILNINWDEGFNNSYGSGEETGRFSEFAADLTAPIVVNQNLAVLTGITSEIVSVDFSNTTPDLNVYGVGLKLGLNVTHNEKWSGTYLSIPKISADQLNFEKQNIQLGWIALLKRTVTPTQNFKFGFYTNSEIFGPFIVPLLGYYSLTDKWEINLLAPLSAQFEYLISQQIKTGVHFKGIIKSYELNEMPGYLTKANNEVSWATTLQWGKIVWLTNIGTTIGRNVRIYPDLSYMDFAISALKIGDDRVQINNDLADGFFIKTGLILRFSTL